jgi:hypothetical protein
MRWRSAALIDYWSFPERWGFTPRPVQGGRCVARTSDTTAQLRVTTQRFGPETPIDPQCRAIAPAGRIETVGLSFTAKNQGQGLDGQWESSAQPMKTVCRLLNTKGVLHLWVCSRLEPEPLSWWG